MKDIKDIKDSIVNDFISKVMDKSNYISQNERVKYKALGVPDFDPVDDYLINWHKNKRGFSALFDEKRFADQSKLNVDPLTQYRQAVTKGAELSPTVFFDVNYYKSQIVNRVDVKDAVLQGDFVSFYHHFLNSEEYSPHPLYKVKHKQLLGLNDFNLRELILGRSEEVSLTPLFDPEFYKSFYKGVNSHIGSGRTFSCALQHFIEFGSVEKKIPCPDFDDEYYVKVNPDIAEALESKAVISPAWHWIYSGAIEGRSPNKFFDSRYYLENNPTVISEMRKLGVTSTFEHFMLLGKSRGFKCNVPRLHVSLDEDATKVAFDKSAELAHERLFRLSKVDLYNQKTNFSIILPVHNNSRYTAKILTQLVTSSETRNAEIIVVDDCSNDDTTRVCKLFDEVKYFRNSVNKGFPASCNVGIRNASRDYVFILNNDIEFYPGSFNAALEECESDSDIGSVGGVITRTNYLLQEAGSRLTTDGSAKGMLRDMSAFSFTPYYRQEVDFCSAAFVCFPMRVLREVGGFDEKFSPGYYEEVDLSLRIRKAGYKNILSPKVMIKHYEFASFAKGRPPMASFNLMTRHKEIFTKKHPDLNGFLTESGRGEKRILFIEDNFPVEQMGSGFVRSSLIIKLLRLQGYQVTLYILHPDEREIKPHIISSLMECKIYTSNCIDLQGLLGAEDFDYIWLCRSHNGERVGDRIRSYYEESRSKPYLIFDTEAIAGLREVEIRKRLGVEVSPEEVRSLITDELALSSYADKTILVNEYEKELFSQCFPLQNAGVLGHAFENITVDEKLGFDKSNGVIFAGAVYSEESPNFDSLKWFIENVWPKVIERTEHIKLYVCGYWSPAVERDFLTQATRVQFLGLVDDLNSELRSKRVFIAPTRIAAGIPHKVHHSMSVGLPALVSPLLIRQLNLQESDGVIDASCEDDGEEFARKLVELHDNKKLWNKLHSSLCSTAKVELSVDNFNESLKDILKVD